MNEMITVIKCEVNKEAAVVQIEHGLKSLQQSVDCETIEAVYPYKDEIAIICDEDGKLIGKMPNRAILDETETEILDIVVGTFLVVGYDCKSSEFVSLSDELQRKYFGKYRYPDIFVHGSSGLTVSHMTDDGCIRIF